MRTSSEQFIKTYMANYKKEGGVQITADALGVTTAAVHQRVSFLRKKGVKLPVKRVPGNATDVVGLNQLIKSLKG